MHSGLLRIAIHLADRLLVLSGGPARRALTAAFDVTRFPHPRKLSSRAAQELKVAILRELGVDADSAG